MSKWISTSPDVINIIVKTVIGAYYSPLPYIYI